MIDRMNRHDDHTTTSTTNSATADRLRVRWAGVGAAIAVTFGAGGLGLVTAAGSDDASSFVPITACRLIDIRDGTNRVGGRK